MVRKARPDASEMAASDRAVILRNKTARDKNGQSIDSERIWISVPGLYVLSSRRAGT